LKIAIFSVVPSPYQRDLFRELRKIAEVDVYYLEASAPDSPWDTAQLESWEKVLPGKVMGSGRTRSHFNWGYPSARQMEQYDLAILNLPITSISLQYLGRRLLCPWIFWGELLRENKNRPLKRMLQWLLLRVVNKSKGILAVGSVAGESYQRSFPQHNIYSQPYYCEVGSFAEASSHRIPAPNARFLFCGQMIERKGIDTLIEAFALCAQEDPNIELTLIGRKDSEQAYLETLDSNLQSKIHLLGFIQPAQLPFHFARADVFVLPSRHEGWGVVVNQALSNGLPVICSNQVGAAHDLVVEEENGLIVPCDDPQALAKAMLRFSQNRDFLHWSSDSARKTAPEITPKKGAQQLLESIEHALAAS